MATDRARGTDALILLVSIALLVAIWAVAAAIAQSRVVPSPGAVLEFVAQEARSGELWHHLASTLARVAAAFVLAMAIGTAAGVALGSNRLADRLFDPWLVLLLNMPALVVIVLAYIWFGLTEAAAVGAVALTKIPNVVVTVREGARALDPGLRDVAAVFRFGRLRTLRHVVLPQLQPYLAAASRNSVALIWKIVLVVEMLGRSNGIGFQIHTYFQFFDVRAIVGYALVFVLVMLAVEIALIQPMERRATRWRKRDA